MDDDKIYPDATGQRWRVDPRGTHGWWSWRPDAPHGGTDLSAPLLEHGATNLCEGTYRRYSRVEAEAPEVEAKYPESNQSQQARDAIKERAERRAAERCPLCNLTFSHMHDAGDPTEADVAIVKEWIGDRTGGGMPIVGAVTRLLFEHNAKCMIAQPDILADLTAKELRNIAWDLQSGYGDDEALAARGREIAERFERLAKERK